MNIICPYCNQVLDATGVPSRTKVSCNKCSNYFVTPEFVEALPVAKQLDEKKKIDIDDYCPINFFQRITTFRGRIGRFQYFLGFLFKLTLMLIGGLICLFLIKMKLDDVAMVISIPVFLAIMWINLSMQARRLHDMGQSGLWLILYAVPLVNYLFALYIFIACLANGSNNKNNKYGHTQHDIF